jgi:hypothetical protein
MHEMGSSRRSYLKVDLGSVGDLCVVQDGNEVFSSVVEDLLEFTIRFLQGRMVMEAATP